ncbi:MAG: hypothetical protein AB1634_07920 [Thermodesulfobacteriota bacterium]
MRTTSRTATVLVLAAMAAAPLLTPASAFAEEEPEKPSATLAVSALSQYVWRGWIFSRHSVVVQPSLTVGYKGFGMNLWGNMDTDRYDSDPTTPDPQDNASDWNETDLTLSYDGSYGMLNYGVGYIYYGLDIVSSDDTQELYVKLGLDTLLSPTLTIYRDIDLIPGWYVTLGVSHSFPLTDTISLDLGARAGYYNSDDDAFTKVNSTDEFSCLHDGVLSAALTIPVGEIFTVSPQVAWSFALSNTASDRLEADNLTNFQDDESSIVYGGVTVSMAF